MLGRVPQVLGRTQPNGDSLLSVSAVVDGIVTFEDVGDAERFAALLEADGIDEVPMQQLSPLGSHSVLRQWFACTGGVATWLRAPTLLCNAVLPACF